MVHEQRGRGSPGLLQGTTDRGDAPIAATHILPAQAIAFWSGGILQFVQWQMRGVKQGFWFMVLARHVKQNIPLARKTHMLLTPGADWREEPNRLEPNNIYQK